MALQTITIRVSNTGRTHSVPAGYNLEQVYDMLQLDMPHGATSAKVNNKVEGLHYTLFSGKDVEFLDTSSASGLRTYTRSLFFVLYKAAATLFPGSRLRIEISLAGGFYCRLLREGTDTLTADEVAALKQAMQEIIAADLPFRRVTAPTTEAAALFRQHGQEDKAQLLESCGKLYTHYYTLDGLPDYFYGSLLVRTSQIYLFDVMPWGGGLILRLPDAGAPDELRPWRKQDKMFDVFRENHRWQDILGVSTIGQLAEACRQGYGGTLINVSEALQEKKIAALADRIAARPELRVILIAGPSSSGKTTFAKRLSVQLAVCGLRPVPVSLDDYFVDREKTPLDADGQYDFEHIHALNIPLFNQQMRALLAGEEVELPRYNFLTGKSEQSGNRLRLRQGDLLVLEGIHALNPELTAELPAECKFRIYASALTSVLLDFHNYIPTTDNRLLRRIVRDNKYRGYSALDTIRRWPSVRRGEDRWIFPFQEEADEMVNTALLFELAALRGEALPLLEAVPESEPEYSEAYRLRKFLSYLPPLDTKALPPTSLLREFLGGSTFKY
ncbi:MAG: nucleoside kinase [Bacteroidaceae bacterium]|nr:nucleoside kinase [Bacteroidaceae bacterium]